MQNFIRVNLIMQKQKRLKKKISEIRNKIKKSQIKKIRKDLYGKEKGLESENEKEKKQNAEKL